MAGGGRGETKAKGRHASSGGSRERGSGGLMSSTMVRVGARMSRAGAQFKRAESEGAKGTKLAGSIRPNAWGSGPKVYWRVGAIVRPFACSALQRRLFARGIECAGFIDAGRSSD